MAVFSSPVQGPKVAGKRRGTNPFYVLLVIVGVAFAVTACAYGLMSFVAVRSSHFSLPEASSSGLLGFLEQKGAMLLTVELGLLAVLTVSAIATDGYWNRRLPDQ